MRPVIRLPSDTPLTAASETNLRLFVAHQKYNTRTRRLAEKELRRRMTRTASSLSAAPEALTASAEPVSAERPKGSLADIAWLGVLLGAGALTLHVISWWGGL